MATHDVIVWDELFREIPSENLVELLQKIYCELAEYKIENQEKINPDDVICLSGLRLVIRAITRMEKQACDS